MNWIPNTNLAEKWREYARRPMALAIDQSTIKPLAAAIQIIEYDGGKIVTLSVSDQYLMEPGQPVELVVKADAFHNKWVNGGWSKQKVWQTWPYWIREGNWCYLQEIHIPNLEGPAFEPIVDSDAPLLSVDDLAAIKIVAHLMA